MSNMPEKSPIMNMNTANTSSDTVREGRRISEFETSVIEKLINILQITIHECNVMPNGVYNKLWTQHIH